MRYQTTLYKAYITVFHFVENCIILRPSIKPVVWYLQLNLPKKGWWFFRGFERENLYKKYPFISTLGKIKNQKTLYFIFFPEQYIGFLDLCFY